MSEISAMHSGMAGIQTGMNGVRQNAHTIATHTLGTKSDNTSGYKEVTEAVVDMKVNQQQVEASAKLIKTQDEMLGTLLDELA